MPSQNESSKMNVYMFTYTLINRRDRQINTTSHVQTDTFIKENLTRVEIGF